MIWLIKPGQEMEKVNIEEDKLPPLYPSTMVVGEVTKEAGEECGLLPGTPVVIGGGDGPCAACRAGVWEKEKPIFILVLLPGLLLPLLNLFMTRRKELFHLSSFRKGLFMPTGTMQSAGGSYPVVSRCALREEKILAQELEVSAYQLMDLEASKVPPGCDGLLFLPYLLGERAPWWNPHARGIRRPAPLIINPTLFDRFSKASVSIFG